jgi:hypothetical protein
MKISSKGVKSEGYAKCEILLQGYTVDFFVIENKSLPTFAIHKQPIFPFQKHLKKF